MPPKKAKPASPPLLEDLIRALQDESVVTTLDAFSDNRLAAMTVKIADLKMTNFKQSRELLAANQRIEVLEAYSHRADIIITICLVFVCRGSDSFSVCWCPPADHARSSSLFDIRHSTHWIFRKFAI